MQTPNTINQLVQGPRWELKTEPVSKKGVSPLVCILLALISFSCGFNEKYVRSSLNKGMTKTQAEQMLSEGVYNSLFIKPLKYTGRPIREFFYYIYGADE